MAFLMDHDEDRRKETKFWNMFQVGIEFKVQIKLLLSFLFYRFRKLEEMESNSKQCEFDQELVDH